MCRRISVLLFLCLCLLHDGLGQTEQADKLSKSTSTFGFGLFRQLASPDSNVIFSPLSIYTALAMTYLGAKGSTKNELRSVLALESGFPVHSALRDVFASFPTSNPNVTLRLANTLYYNDAQVQLVSSYVQTLFRQYGVEPQAFQPPQPEVQINQWISDQTAGAIKKFLQPSAIQGNTLILLLNAVYFQGTWKNIFDERMTIEGDFTTTSGQTVRVPIMSRDSPYSVRAVGNGIAARVLELPYGTDGRFSMFFILPDEVDGLHEVEQKLTVETLEAAVANMPALTRYEIRIPKFSLRFKTSLKQSLRAMGLVETFNRANLSGMIASPSNVEVSDVVHEAFIEVNERGTIAAAVTVVKMARIRPPVYDANHPFLLVLRDNQTKLNLFMGRVADPTQG